MNSLLRMLTYVNTHVNGDLRLTRRLPPTHPCGALRATGRNHDGSFTSIAITAIDAPDPVAFPVMLSITRWLSTNVSRPVRQSLSLDEIIATPVIALPNRGVALEQRMCESDWSRQDQVLAQLD